MLRRNRHCYIFCDQETMFVLKPVAEEVGFRFWKPIVWDKVTMGMGYHYRARYEFVLFFEKGKRRLNDLSIPDVLGFKRVRNGYPAEKPLELIQTLIMQSSEPDELVLDPFFGSGTTILASRRLGRAAWGTDTAHAAHQATAERLAAEGYYDGAVGLPGPAIAVPAGLTKTYLVELSTLPFARSMPGTRNVDAEGSEYAAAARKDRQCWQCTAIAHSLRRGSRRRREAETLTSGASSAHYETSCWPRVQKQQ